MKGYDVEYQDFSGDDVIVCTCQFHINCSSRLTFEKFLLASGGKPDSDNRRVKPAVILARDEIENNCRIFSARMNAIT